MTSLIDSFYAGSVPRFGDYSIFVHTSRGFSYEVFVLHARLAVVIVVVVVVALFVAYTDMCSSPSGLLIHLYL